ncbi:MAG: T9SS type A sorting domain-containing protein [bacterium]|nr:T9SS type A sorting domain-containing protein [bacterium]
MRRNFILVFAFFVAVTASNSFAQHPGWTVYDSSNSGLFDDWVRAIAIDGNDKWIGTGWSLTKFDGTNWTAVIQVPGISTIIVGGGNKWVGNHYGGLMKFDGTTWTIYDTSNSPLPDIRVSAIALEGSNVWVGTLGDVYAGGHPGGGLAKFDGTNWTLYDTLNSGLPDNWITAIAIEGNNKWIGDYDDGLVKFDGTNWTVYDTLNSGLPDNDVRVITIDGNNKWIGTWGGGIAKFDGANWTVYDTLNSGLPDNDVYSLVIQGSNIWAGTMGGGIAKFDGTNWTVYDTSNSGLPSNDITVLTLDGNKLWVGTFWQGIAVYNTAGVEEKSNIKNQISKMEIIKNKICLSVPKAVEADIKLYDLCGREKNTVYSGTLTKGNYVFTPNVKKSGVYFVRVTAGNYNVTKKITIIK